MSDDQPPRDVSSAAGDSAPIVLHLPTGAGRLDSTRSAAVRDGFDQAIALTAPLLDISNIDVFAIDSPEQAIPGWGCGGYTYSAHTIIVGLDPLGAGLTADRVRATIVHELHHVARERGPGCGTSLRERIVSEGLAMLFEEQVLGRASEFAHVDISDHDIARAVEQLDQEPADDGLWFFHTGNVPLWFGYTLGYRWAREHADRTGQNASDLTHTPATTITNSIVLPWTSARAASDA